MPSHVDLARRIVPSAGSEYPMTDVGHAIALGHAVDVLRADAPLLLSTADMHRLRQWFNSMQDTNPAYVEDDDRALYNRILAVLRDRSEWK